MIKNYFIVAFRNLLKTKGFSLINISGLAVGMATAILILTWMYHEISVDRYHVNRENIYQAYNRGMMDGKLQCWQNTPGILGPTLKEEFADVDKVARAFGRWFVTVADDRKLSTEALIVDPTFLQIFSFPLAEGDPNTVLNDGYSIVVTKKMATKMFSTTDVLGKTIRIDNTLYHITGILEDLPSNTDFHFDYLLSWDYIRRAEWDDGISWSNNGVFTYVLLKDGVRGEAMNEKIRDITIRHSNGTVKEEIFLHPIDRWHLYSRFENGVATGGHIEMVRLFGIIGVFVLLVACINFMNLSTARSEKRAKEVGVRKVAGAARNALIWQFLIESVTLTMIAAFIALALVQLALPFFKAYIGKVEVPIAEPAFWLSIVAFILLTGLVAGSYPAFFLSSFKPVQVLKGTFRKSTSQVSPRKMLVVVQFTFAVILIISTMVVVQQINFTQSRERGYKTERLLYHWITGDLRKDYAALKSDLIQSGIASSVTRTLSPMTMILSSTWDLEWQGKVPGDKTDFHRLSADEGLVKTTSLELIAGRDLDVQQYPTDSTGMLINEAAAKAFGFKDPIGQIIKESDGTAYHIVGVVKDFITGSPDQMIKPVVMGGIKNNGLNVIYIKLNDHIQTGEAIAKIQALFLKYNPEYPFEYHFADEDYARKFANNKRIATLVFMFTVLTIFISCLGLFGLASYMAETRVKEIGIRKVLGASVMRITTLISRDFVLLVLIAIAVGAPLAWYATSIWLEKFPYRTTTGWWTFAMAGALCLSLAIITVGYQSVKAAMANPVKSLRNE